MDYKYDIFISYRREKETRKWIENHFVPLLNFHIHNEIGRYPIIFIDDKEIEIGSDWPIYLGTALGTSRTIIPLWTKTFLHSRWCTCEIGHMLEREKKLGFRTIEKPSGLIFPTIIHDGETLPVHLSTIQSIEIQKLVNPRMSKDSPTGEILAEKLEPLGRAISIGIENAPDWQEDWKIDAVNDFVKNHLKGPEHGQSQSPKFT